MADNLKTLCYVSHSQLHSSMGKRIILATFLGAIIAFAWGFASWSLLNWHTPKTFENNDEVARVIQQNSDGHGMYIIPPYTEDGEPDMTAIENGPFVYATVRPGKLTGWVMWKAMALSFAVNLFLALLIATLMTKRSHYRSKVLVGTAFGLFAGITASLPLMIWMELPAGETVARLCDPVITWTLASLVMALIVKKPKRRIFSS